MMAENQEYKKIYLLESDELLQQMNKSLLILEKSPGNTGALNAIFRSAHTLKSMSASMGYSLVTELSHKMEDVLDQLRTGTIEVSDNVVNILFKSFDGLELMVNNVQKDKKESLDIQPFISALDKIMVQKPKIAEEKISSGYSLNVFEKKTLARVKKEGYKCFDIKVVLTKSCVRKSVRAFMIFRNLHTIGEVIKSIPENRALEEEKFDREFGFGSGKDTAYP